MLSLLSIFVGSLLLSTTLTVPGVYYAVKSRKQTEVNVPINYNSDTDLPGCQIHEGVGCTSSDGSMDAKHATKLWNTPPRNHSRWLKGFQDMSVLQGYARLQYNAAHTQCVVTIVTKTASSLQLQYGFNGTFQSAASRVFDKSFTGQLKVSVIARTGETLVLDDIDFIWNAAPIKSRPGDFRNGQKGAIVEMFGWPDEDIEKECQILADAGYLGVKLFPHHEQVMSVQPFENELNPWYFMYQPVSYRLQGRAGTRDQLRKMINTCRSVGVRVYADAVVNHMTGNGNDASFHRNPNSGCTYWPPKNSSAGENISPYYTPAYTYGYNDWNGKANNALEFPGVPYGPMDFHCDKALNSWSDPYLLNTGWLSGLCDLDTSKDYVRQRIADYFVDLLSIGFSGFRIDAAKHIHPKDLAAIFAKFKANLGGNIPEDWITWLEVLTGGEAYLLVRDSQYSYTTGLTREMKAVGLSDSDIEKVKIWWCGYPNEPNNDEGTLSRTRKVIQNDDHDQQNDGSSSRDMHDKGCVLVKGCAPDKHRAYEVKLFQDPYEVNDNDNEYPIRLVLSSYYFLNGVKSIPDGQSDCSLCKVTCETCKSRSYAPAYVAGAKAYEGGDYTRVHRDAEIIAAMRAWMKM
ncbi:putative Pancreatic alpha-amylase [Blattamonas nauphoetae]|uniref:Alpha-amylase n=1 Tax=Blattamonas nauphoetae TaxID=2049346 RepID=A0ABQ9XW09_9EUKA|nr:putative Pancreatic alpha-amylase [Blattamonas nauphoetae]